MAAGVIFMQWESYAGGAAFFASEPLTFNSRRPGPAPVAPAPVPGSAFRRKTAARAKGFVLTAFCGGTPHSPE
jgi:hypothetical protein